MAKYFWGNNPADTRILMLGVLYAGAVFTFTLLSFTTDDAPTGISQGMALSAVKGSVLATVGWVWIYFNGMGSQVFIKLNKKNLGAAAGNVAGRIMGNQHEHATVFLSLLWMFTAYGNTSEAAALGMLYVIHRAQYQLIYA